MEGLYSAIEQLNKSSENTNKVAALTSIAHYFLMNDRDNSGQLLPSQKGTKLLIIY